MSPQEFLESVRDRAKEYRKTIVYPDATDERAIRAARRVVDEDIAAVVLVGERQLIAETAVACGTSLDGIGIVDPSRSGKLDDFSATFFELRKHKGISEAEARDVMTDPLFFGAMMVRKGLADGSVAGSLSTTGDVIRAGILCIGLEEGINTVSSFFLMVFPEKVYAFADCAVLPDPDEDQLADIAVTTARNYRKLLREEPRVAMLSFSTRGSAEHPMVDAVREAVRRTRSKNPGLPVDGELQVDAAIVPSVAERKAPDSEVAGRANVLIFPDLNAGNIAYKVAQRMGGAEAIGPLVQGLQKPAFDLSRGCSVEDIVNVTAFNVIMGVE